MPTKSTSIPREPAWERRKHIIVREFMQELDTRLCNGAIRRATAATGGVKIVWEKVFSSTAGLTIWGYRPERKPSYHVLEPLGWTGLAHATIKLSARHLINEKRLRDTVAHEFCHLAQHIVSKQIGGQHHGRTFKYWGRRCNEEFKNYNVDVKTFHNYGRLGRRIKPVNRDLS